MLYESDATSGCRASKEIAFSANFQCRNHSLSAASPSLGEGARSWEGSRGCCLQSMKSRCQEISSEGSHSQRRLPVRSPNVSEFAARQWLRACLLAGAQGAGAQAQRGALRGAGHLPDGILRSIPHHYWRLLCAFAGSGSGWRLPVARQPAAGHLLLRACRHPPALLSPVSCTAHLLCFAPFL